MVFLWFIEFFKIQSKAVPTPGYQYQPVSYESKPERFMKLCYKADGYVVLQCALFPSSLPILNMSGEFKMFQAKSSGYKREHNKVKAEGEFILSMTAFPLLVWFRSIFLEQRGRVAHDSSLCAPSTVGSFFSSARSLPYTPRTNYCPKADLCSWGWNLTSRSL